MSTGEKRIWEQNEFNAAVTQVDASPFDADKFKQDQIRQNQQLTPSSDSNKAQEGGDAGQAEVIPESEGASNITVTPQVDGISQESHDKRVTDEIGQRNETEGTYKSLSEGVLPLEAVEAAPVGDNTAKSNTETICTKVIDDITSQETPIRAPVVEELGVQASGHSEPYVTESSLSVSSTPHGKSETVLEDTLSCVKNITPQVNETMQNQTELSQSNVADASRASVPEKALTSSPPHTSFLDLDRRSPHVSPQQACTGNANVGASSSLRQAGFTEDHTRAMNDEVKSSPDIGAYTRTEMRSEPEQANTTPQIYSRCFETSTYTTPLTAPLPYLGGLSNSNAIEVGKLSPPLPTEASSRDISPGAASFIPQTAPPRPALHTPETPEIQTRISRIEEAFKETTLRSAPPGDSSSSVPAQASSTFDFNFLNISPLPAEPRTPEPAEDSKSVELYDTPADFNLSQLHFFTPGSAKPRTSQPGSVVAPAEETSLLGELLGKDFIATPAGVTSNDHPPPSQKVVAETASVNPASRSHSRATSRKQSSPQGGSRGRANLLCSDDDESVSQGEASEVPSEVRPLPGMPPKWEDFPEAYDVRPIAEGVPPEQLEEHERRTIYVLHKGETNIVSWMEETPARDVREAILCACDSIADTGFLLRELIPLDKGQLKAMLDAHEDEIGGQLILVEDNGKNVYYKRGQVFAFEDFHRLEGNKLYYLELSREREDLKSITGDRWRRLLVPIKPFQHVEAQKAIQRMRQGTNLLKHTTLGYPHLRHFQLSADLKRLIWYSAGKPKDQTVIQLVNVSQIKIGIDDSVKLNGLPQVYTFTVVAGKDGTYQLAAKDEEEFDLWVTGLKALACWAHGQLINKAQLLSHCRRFRQALQRQDLSVRIDDKSNTTSFSLINAIKLNTLKKSDLLKKEVNLRCRLRAAREKAKLIDLDSLAKRHSSDESVSPPTPEENSIYGAAMFDHTMSDDQMEFQKMCELMDLVDSLLADTRTQLEALNIKPLESDSLGSTTSPVMRQHTDENRSPVRDEHTAVTTTTSPTVSPENRNAVLNNVTKLLWKAEVDTENIEDIYKRLTEPPTISMHKIWGEVNTNIVSLTKNITSWVQTRGTSMLPMLFSGSDPAAPTTTPASHVEETGTEQAATTSP